MKRVLLSALLTVFIAGCIDYDESTYITDDMGVRHHTKHYLKDTRGKNYFPEKIKGIGRKQFIFDPKVAAWAAYDEAGNRVMTGSGSGGKEYCEDVGKPCRTVTGSFRVYNKRGLDCKSGEYPVETTGGAKMPYCMYFYRGFTIHAGYEVPPYNSSHGCIRVLPSAAKWLNEDFLTLGSQVTVLSYPDENGDRDDVSKPLGPFATTSVIQPVVPNLDTGNTDNNEELAQSKSEAQQPIAQAQESPEEVIKRAEADLPPVYEAG